MPSSDEVQRHSVHTLVFRSLKRSHEMFICDQGILPPPHTASEDLKRSVKRRDQYGPVLSRVAEAKKAAAFSAAAAASAPQSAELTDSASLNGSADVAMDGPVSAVQSQVKIGLWYYNACCFYLFMTRFTLQPH